MRIFLLLALAIFISGNVLAEDKLYLYGDYYAGMSPEELLKSGPAQCDKYPDNTMICNRAGVEFSGLTLTQFFEFKNDALNCVAFGGHLSPQIIMLFMEWLKNEHYAPISALASGKSIDFSLLYEDGRKQEFEKEAENFNRDLPNADSIKSWLLKSSVIDMIQDTGKMPENAILTTLGGSKSEGNMFLCFEPAKNYKFKKF